jgi:drug/metabolite transporter (DMT)-like permease
MVVAMGLSGTIGLLVMASAQTAQTVVFFRCLIGGLSLLGWLAWQGRWKRLERPALLWLVTGAAALILNWLCLFSAYRLSSISIATVVYHVQPFFLILLAALDQRQLPKWDRVACLVLALVGVALTSGLDDSTQNGKLLPGVVLALTAAFLYALATLATRKLTAYAPAQIAGLQLTLGAAVLFPFTSFSIDLFNAQTWWCIGALGIVHTGLMYNLMYAAFQRLSADHIAALSFIYPLVAVAVDVMALGTRLSGAQCIGMLLILAGVLANQRAAKGYTLVKFGFLTTRRTND